ncbi:hypothetical protein ACWEJP_11360 [Streptomyces sp. NPDC004749]
MPTPESEARPQSAPSPSSVSMSDLLASCAAASAVSTPPHEQREQQERREEEELEEGVGPSEREERRPAA